MVELRWLVLSNPCTAAQVKQYSEACCVSMNEAKRILVDQTKPKLQYRNGMGYGWQDVPVVVKPHKRSGI